MLLAMTFLSAHACTRLLTNRGAGLPARQRSLLRPCAAPDGAAIGAAVAGLGAGLGMFFHRRRALASFPDRHG